MQGTPLPRQFLLQGPPDLFHLAPCPCSSRKGTTEAAAALAKGAEARAPVTPFTAAAAGPGGALPSSSFVRTPQQQQRLRAAAAQAHAKALAAVLVAGVGFHNAAMEPPDRELVEGLFKAGDLAVSCGAMFSTVHGAWSAVSTVPNCSARAAVRPPVCAGAAWSRFVLGLYVLWVLLHPRSS